MSAIEVSARSPPESISSPRTFLFGSFTSISIPSSVSSTSSSITPSSISSSAFFETFGLMRSKLAEPPPNMSVKNVLNSAPIFSIPDTNCVLRSFVSSAMSVSSFATDSVRSATSCTKNSSRSFTSLYSLSTSSFEPIPSSSRRIFMRSSSCLRARCCVRSSCTICSWGTSTPCSSRTVYSKYMLAARPRSDTASCNSFLNSCRSRSRTPSSRSIVSMVFSTSRCSFIMRNISRSASRLSLASDSIARFCALYSSLRLSSLALMVATFSSASLRVSSRVCNSFCSASRADSGGVTFSVCVRSPLNILMIALRL